MFGDMLYVDTPYRPEFGSFSKPVGVSHGVDVSTELPPRYKVSQWNYCRDLFHGQLYNLNLFFFSHRISKGRSIAEFMRKIESQLNVYPLSKYGPTQRKTIMWIKPSRWWTVRAMRRSLFTILLRAGSGYSYTKDDFEEALYGEPYLFETQQAVRRFMSGFTVYTGKKRGWRRQFHEEHLSDEMIDSLLIKP